MPNQRAVDQVLLPFTAKEEFVDELDKALRQLGISNRSQFIRDAIYEELKRKGIMLPKGLTAATERFGNRAPRNIDGAGVRSNSKQAAVRTKLLKKGVASVQRPDAK